MTQLNLITGRPEGHPNWHAAVQWGCTCRWIPGAIVHFDPACPILELHRGVPWNIHQTRLPL